MNSRPDKTIRQRIYSEHIRHVAAGVFGPKNTSWYAIIYAAIVLITIAWLPDGISDLIDYDWSGSDWLHSSYKFLVSVSILVFLGLQIQRVKGDSERLEVVKKSPQQVKALGIFLSTVGRDLESTQKERIRIEAALNKSDFSTSVFLEKPWEMPLKAIEYHKQRLEVLYVFTSSGEMGSTGLLNLFSKVVKRLYPALLIRSVIQDGINFEDVKQVFTVVESFYTRSKIDGYQESDIIVDVTGGQKPNSIGASIATLITGRKFQYISTGSKEVLAYDVWYIDQDVSLK